MQSVRGTYENGQLKLEKEFLTKKPIPVIITFLEKVEEEENEQPLTPLQSQEPLIEKIREPLIKNPKPFQFENAPSKENTVPNMEKDAPSENEEYQRLLKELKDSLPKKLKAFDLETAHFEESRKALESYKGSFADAVIEERRSEL